MVRSNDGPDTGRVPDLRRTRRGRSPASRGHQLGRSWLGLRRSECPAWGRSSGPSRTSSEGAASLGRRRGQRREDSHGGNWSDWVSKAMYGRSLSRRTGGLFICTYGSRWPSGATSVDSRTTSRHSEISGERPHTAVSDVCGPTERHASLRLCASEEITTLFGPSDGRLGENRFP